MRASRAAGGVIVVLLATTLVGCGKSGLSDSGASHSDQCRSDHVSSAAPRVRVRLPGGSLTNLTGTRGAPCGTTVEVDGNGGANTLFALSANCRLDQGDRPSKVAELITRSPQQSLFQLREGRVRCVFGGALVSQPAIDLCGMGVLLADGNAIGSVSCDPEPLFQVAVYQGSVRVTAPDATEREIAGGQILSYDFENKDIGLGPAEFSEADIGLFEELAKPLGVEVSQSPTSQPSLEFPMELSAPTIAQPSPGFTLVADPGRWSANPSFTYQWQGDCTPEGSECVDIPGATGPTYDPTSDDCPAVRVLVTAANEAGVATATSDPFALTCIG